MVTEEKLREMLVKRVGPERGGMTRLAEEWGVTLQYVSSLIKGNQPISDMVAGKLGYRELERPRVFEKLEAK